jgi:hypothetical protein
LAHFFRAHRFQMPFPMKNDESINPVAVRLLGSQRIMLEPDGLSRAIEEFGLAPAPAPSIPLA